MNEPGWAFEFGVPIAAWVVLLLLAVCAVGTWAFWWPRLAQVPRARRTLLAALRTGALVLIIFMLLDPMLIGKKRQPAEDYVVLLFDDSRSMRIAGDDGISRGDRLMKAYESARAGFEEKLRETHHVAMYRFGAAASRIDSLNLLAFDQNESDQPGAIHGALKDLAGAKIAAVVLFSDGVRQGPGAAAASQAFGPGVPILSVGVDTESTWRDIDLKAVNASRTNFDKSPVALTVQVAAQGLKGRSAIVEVLEGTRVATSKQLDITEDDQVSNLRLEYIPVLKGWTGGEARVRLTGGADRVTENNARGYVVDNRDHTFRILYLCGRPNWQNKFVRLALEPDTSLKLSSLVRMRGPEKGFKFKARNAGTMNPLFEGFNESEVQAPRYDEAYFARLGLTQTELAKGYPDQQADLYPFDLAIWGDIEAGYFSSRQFEITRDFVAKRGGSLLLLGGPRSLSEGKYSGTLVEGMLPVLLSDRAGGKNLNEFVQVKPTVDGVLSGVWSLDPDPAANEQVWNAMPDLFGTNLFPMTRAGATELARAASDDKDVDGQPLFVWQRYGLGRTAVLATGETWQWRMRNDPDNDTHGKFWRQLVRSLVNDVPAPLVLKSRGEELTAGKPSKFEFVVRDGLFEKREGLNTSIKVTPEGQPARELAAEESIAEPGIYTAEATLDTTGMHRLEVAAMNEKSEVVGTLDQAVYVNPDLREYQSANYNPAYLKDLAKTTRGGFYALNELDKIPGAIPRLETEVDIPEIRHLWQFPALYIVLALIFSIEWFQRRKYGQP